MSRGLDTQMLSVGVFSSPPTTLYTSPNGAQTTRPAIASGAGAPDAEATHSLIEPSRRASRQHPSAPLIESRMLEERTRKDRGG